MPVHGELQDRPDSGGLGRQSNPSWCCPRTAQQIALAFGVEVDKNLVRRILSAQYRSASDAAGPSWLTFLGHMIDLRKQEAFSSTPPACSALPRGTRSRSVLSVAAKFALGLPIFAARQRQEGGEGNSDGATPGWFHDLLHSRRWVNSNHHPSVVSRECREA